MRRTQIYLSDEQGRLLSSRSKATGATISQLIREAIDETYRRPKSIGRAERVAVARRTAGAWRDFQQSGADYVKRVRGGRRLARVLHEG